MELHLKVKIITLYGGVQWVFT